ncbi:MAG TPA: lipocalin-like domain-containing protein [Deinococcales bacterium]|nr:lipocalin-like domain-containing protein [Deinococcales bacterium]
MRLLNYLALAAVLAACAPAAALDPFQERQPSPWGDLAAHRAPVEWWYVNGHARAGGRDLAFASTIFQVYVPRDTVYQGLRLADLYPGPFYFGHTVVADRRSGQFRYSELSSLPGAASAISASGSASTERLDARLGGWRTLALPDGSILRQAGLADGTRLDLRLRPLKPGVVHGPGWSGTAATGRMYYTSFTRLAVTGTIGGQEANGTAWFDHQWGGGDGDRSASSDPRWDWLGLQLDDGRDVMAYRVRDAAGRTADQFATVVDADGTARSTREVVMEGRDPWTAPSGARYPTTWTLRFAGGETLVATADLRAELRTTSPPIAYLEVPATVSGSATGAGFIELTGYAPVPAGSPFGR